MNFDNSTLNDLKLQLGELDDIMKEHSFIRAGQWDYERVTYDRKFEIEEGVFYLRIMGIADEGDIGAGKALIKLKNPLLGKYYYPHGVEYVSEHFPDSLVSKCQKVISELNNDITAFLNK